MAARERQTGLGGGRAFTARIPYENYKEIEDYAWERRLTFAAAVSHLLLKAIAIENEAEENVKKINGAVKSAT